MGLPAASNKPNERLLPEWARNEANRFSAQTFSLELDGHGLEGLTAVVDINRGEVIRVDDTGIHPVPSLDRNYAARFQKNWRKDLKPIEIAKEPMRNHSSEAVKRAPPRASERAPRATTAEARTESKRYDRAKEMLEQKFISQEALDVANSTQYGLSMSIYTNDLRKAFHAMDEMQSGIVYVNAPTIGAEIQLPFGGVKNTGNGHREAGTVALDEFTEWKTIYVDYSGRLQRAQIDTGE